MFFGKSSKAKLALLAGLLVLAASVHAGDGKFEDLRQSGEIIPRKDWDTDSLSVPKRQPKGETVLFIQNTQGVPVLLTAENTNVAPSNYAYKSKYADDVRDPLKYLTVFEFEQNSTPDKALLTFGGDGDVQLWVEWKRDASGLSVRISGETLAPTKTDIWVRAYPAFPVPVPDSDESWLSSAKDEVLLVDPDSDDFLSVYLIVTKGKKHDIDTNLWIGKDDFHDIRDWQKGGDPYKAILD